MPWTRFGLKPRLPSLGHRSSFRRRNRRTEVGLWRVRGTRPLFTAEKHFASLIRGTDLGFAGRQQFRHILMICYGGPVRRRQTFVIFCIDIGFVRLAETSQHARDHTSLPSVMASCHCRLC